MHVKNLFYKNVFCIYPITGAELGGDNRVLPKQSQTLVRPAPPIFWLVPINMFVGGGGNSVRFQVFYHDQIRSLSQWMADTVQKQV